ncbi:unnamed protein product [Protopolystoma xenopodis]|uniref:Uncharacterized protein n=1 Tax=Protopolystoma xenopodis TaxID=117903 RepID=A0A3S5CVI8_9PLAT|nr:unnamed protein product [Protopolystoma xenopodis]
MSPCPQMSACLFGCAGQDFWESFWCVRRKIMAGAENARLAVLRHGIRLSYRHSISTSHFVLFASTNKQTASPPSGTIHIARVCVYTRHVSLSKRPSREAHICGVHPKQNDMLATNCPLIGGTFLQMQGPYMPRAFMQLADSPLATAWRIYLI